MAVIIDFNALNHCANYLLEPAVSSGLELATSRPSRIILSAFRKLALRRQTPSYLDLLGKSRCNYLIIPR
jgi:uncharacterized membrane protein (UPF0136 family)